MNAPDKATADARYQAKLAARATGTTPVTVSDPVVPDENPFDPAVVDARFRAKMAARRKAAEVAAAAQAAPTEPTPAPKAETHAKTEAAADASESTAHKDVKVERPFQPNRRG